MINNQVDMAIQHIKNVFKKEIQDKKMDRKMD